MTRMRDRLSVSVLLIAFLAMPPVNAENHTRAESGDGPQPGFFLINESSLNTDERQQWYHNSAGTQLMPYAWYIGLARGPLKGRLESTGVLADPSNEDLHIGFAESTGNGIRVPQMGLTCSFCHTTQFNYNGATYRIDGGPSLQNNAKFGHMLIGSLAGMLRSKHFDAFASGVLKQSGQEATPENIQRLRQAMTMYVARLTDRSGRDISPQIWGPGRIDALGRGGNLVFAQLNQDNLRPANAPVSIPPLWGVWNYDRVQWGGSIRHPLARNIAQVIGVNANLFTSEHPPFEPYVDPSDPYRSSVDVHKLGQLEDLAKKIQPPRWPKAFPAIDREKAARGKQLYHQKGKGGLCAHCHVPKTREQANGGAPRLKVTMIPRHEVGTDPLYLNNFAARRVDTGALGLGILTAGQAVKIMTDEIMVRAGVRDDGDYQGVTNEWSDSKEYIARPHVAVWATAPYLHNGSVPTLYELLSPADQRHDCFVIGPVMEFDPRYVGYAIRGCTAEGGAPDDPGFAFRTALPGNGNGGHEFRNTPNCGTNAKEPGILGCELSHDERLDIIEYLKTCDLDQLILRELPPCRNLE